MTIQKVKREFPSDTESEGSSIVTAVAQVRTLNPGYGTAAYFRHNQKKKKKAGGEGTEINPYLTLSLRSFVSVTKATATLIPV